MVILIQEKYVLSEDSTEAWQKMNIYVDEKFLKKEGKLIIHDTENHKIITCFFSNDTCTSFMVAYYNIHKEYLSKMLNKRYNYNGFDSWNYNYKNKNIELCLREDQGVFIIEACDYISKK